MSVTCDRSVVSPGTMVSSTSKTDHNDITDIVLKVTMNTINHTFRSFMTSFVVPEKIILFMQFGTTTTPDRNEKAEKVFMWR
jgi:hypothetical protein